MGERRAAIPRELPGHRARQSANDTASEFIKRKIREIVKDPKTAHARRISIIPCREAPPIDTDYFETFNRDNVALVDLRAEPIERITPAGIKTRTKEYALDIIVFATGFDAMTGPLLKIDIRGRDGLTLREAWAAGPTTYLGLQVPVSEPLYRDRTRKPVGADQHACRDRAACRVGHRLHRLYARERHRALRGAGRSRAKVGRACEPGGKQDSASARHSFLVSRRQRAGQARACSCLMPAAWSATARSATTSRLGAMIRSRRMPKGISIDRSKRLREAARTGHNRWHPDIAPVIEVEPGER